MKMSKNHHSARTIPRCAYTIAGSLKKKQGLRQNMDVNHRLNFDVHRVVHPNIISIVKPTRYANVSNLFYFGMTLYVFRTVFPSIIRSSRLYIRGTATRICQTDTAVLQVPASKQTAVSAWQMPVTVCTVLNSWWWTRRPSETCRMSFKNKQKLIHWCILLVLL